MIRRSVSRHITLSNEVITAECALACMQLCGIRGAGGGKLDD